MEKELHTTKGGICRNPYNPRLSTGGSSGGSAAALAAGIGSFSIANSVAGSIHFNGIVGVKPQTDFKITDIIGHESPDPNVWEGDVPDKHAKEHQRAT